MKKNWYNNVILYIFIIGVVGVIPTTVMIAAYSIDKANIDKFEASKTPVDWEYLKEPNDITSYASLSRTRVPGGWLVVCSKYNHSSSVFISDPEHTWLVDLECTDTKLDDDPINNHK